MRSDVLRRVRWANVSLALGALATLATVIAWPLVTTPAPRLPPNAARPVERIGDASDAARADATDGDDGARSGEQGRGEARDDAEERGGEGEDRGGEDKRSRGEGQDAGEERGEGRAGRPRRRRREARGWPTRRRRERGEDRGEDKRAGGERRGGRDAAGGERRGARDGAGGQRRRKDRAGGEGRGGEKHPRPRTATARNPVTGGPTRRRRRLRRHRSRPPRHRARPPAAMRRRRSSVSRGSASEPSRGTSPRGGLGAAFAPTSCAAPPGATGRRMPSFRSEAASAAD